MLFIGILYGAMPCDRPVMLYPACSKIKRDTSGCDALCREGLSVRAPARLPPAQPALICALGAAASPVSTAARKNRALRQPSHGKARGRRLWRPGTYSTAPHRPRNRTRSSSRRSRPRTQEDPSRSHPASTPARSGMLSNIADRKPNPSAACRDASGNLSTGVSAPLTARQPATLTLGQLE
jgi:hypothetical protein